MAYGKVFESMFTGSLVGTGPTVFAVWTYCVANAKPPGLVEVHPRILATILGAELDDVLRALEVLCRPDPNSRTPDEDGCKLVQEGNFLYRLPTWPKYNAIRKEEDRRRQNREAQQRWRDKQRLRKQNKPTETHTTAADADDGWLDGSSTAPSQNSVPTHPNTRTEEND